jgi:2-polyprenyl-3-methyl-5-hydroxy-6-metoxy-1,4-benzoquinol methylase
MEEKRRNEQDVWDEVKRLMGNKQITLGHHWSFNLYNDPKRLSFVLSRYKFAAKMASKNKDVLELGCSEGIGSTILSEFAKSYTGVDMDIDAINAAKQNLSSDKMNFIQDDFLGKSYGNFGTVVSLDVVEHIVPVSEQLFFKTIYINLAEDGIGVVGTPNMTSAAYASLASQAGHVNMFDEKKLKTAMERLFHIVFVFGINDEIVHTGFSPMAHYLVCIGCRKKAGIEA